MFSLVLPPSGLQTTGHSADAIAHPEATPDVSSSPGIMSSEPSDKRMIPNWSWTTWGALVVGLSILGVNVFAYVSKGADAGAWLIHTFITPVLAFFGIESINAAKHILKRGKSVAGGGGAILNAVKTRVSGKADGAGTTGAGSSGAGAGAASSAGTTGAGAADAADAGAPDSVTATSGGSTRAIHLDISPHNPDQNAPTPATPASGEEGWCLIGKDNTANPPSRICSSVGASDTCMSGDIFPTQDVCVNPNLRA
jgi:hypothetical protein